MSRITDTIKNLEAMGAVNRRNRNISEAEGWEAMAESVTKLYGACEEVLHQLSTDSDLDTITGAEKYQALTQYLRETMTE